MKSSEIIQAKNTVKNYLDDTGLPKEVCRYIVKELYETYQREALEEAIAEVKEGERNAD